jgi:hypothetical protein
MEFAVAFDCHQKLLIVAFARYYFGVGKKVVMDCIFAPVLATRVLPAPNPLSHALKIRLKISMASIASSMCFSYSLLHNSLG